MRRRKRDANSFETPANEKLKQVRPETSSKFAFSKAIGSIYTVPGYLLLPLVMSSSSKPSARKLISNHVLRQPDTINQWAGAERINRGWAGSRGGPERGARLIWLFHGPEMLMR